jgi:hypothetical protein
MIARTQVWTPAPRRPAFRMQSRWRLARLGLAAFIALALAAASYSETGQRRLMLVLGMSESAPKEPSEPSPHSKDMVTDIAGLLETVRALAAEQALLATRIGTIEHKLDDFTGSISTHPQPAMEAVAAPTPASTPQTTPTAASQPAPGAMANAGDRVSSEPAKTDVHKPSGRKRAFKHVRRTTRPLVLFR